MKSLIRNKYANLYLDAALQLGLHYRVMDKLTSHVSVFNTERKIDIKRHKLHLNVEANLGNSLHKYITSSLLEKVGIPVPSFKVFGDYKEALAYALNLLQSNKPMVIKPSSASEARDITIHPHTDAQVRLAIRKALAGRQAIMIEDYIPGHHYRITMLDGEIIAITQRIPAYIVGDGKKTVKKLIEDKNILRKSGGQPEIVLRPSDKNYMKSAAVTLSKVYPLGEHVRLHNGCDYEVGGERVRIAIYSVPKVNQRMFAKAVKTLGLRFGGIDYISPDITIAHTKLRTAINEINSSPHQDVHYYDTSPHDNYAAKRIIQKLFD